MALPHTPSGSQARCSIGQPSKSQLGSRRRRSARLVSRKQPQKQQKTKQKVRKVFPPAPLTFASRQSPATIMNNSKITTPKVSKDSKEPVKLTMYEYCLRQFQRRSELKADKNKHTNERRFNCSYCQKSFKTKMDAKQHERIHTGERPFKCTFCSAAFAQSSGLQFHVRTHTKEKPFQCATCGQSFSWKSSLDKHERIHLDVKPYACSFCQKSFAQAVSRRHHIANKHSREKSSKCTHCDKVFGTNSGVRTHEKLCKLKK